MDKGEKHPAVYILASRTYGVLYIGVTSALWNRVATHKDGGIKGFTDRYQVHRLVWYEHHHHMDAAILREKHLKKWNRAWKIRIIEEMNPVWNDLHNNIDYVRSLVSDKADERSIEMAMNNRDARLRGHDEAREA